MTMLNVGRPTRPEGAGQSAGHASLTGGRGLLQDEPLIFELGGWRKTGVDLAAPAQDASDLGDLVRNEPIGLPGLRRRRDFWKIGIFAFAMVMVTVLLRETV